MFQELPRGFVQILSILEDLSRLLEYLLTWKSASSLFSEPRTPELPSWPNRCASNGLISNTMWFLPQSAH